MKIISLPNSAEASDEGSQQGSRHDPREEIGEKEYFDGNCDQDDEE